MEGFDVQVTPAGRFVLADVDGKAMPVSLEDYKGRLAEKLFEEAHTLEEFRQLWIDPPSRQALIDNLVAEKSVRKR